MVHFGNIYIPSDIVNCSDYIQSCYDRRKVTIITKTAGVIYDCYISKATLQDVEFPEVDGDNVIQKNIGSGVVFSINEKGNPFIIDTIPNRDEMISIQEGEREMYKSLDGCFFKIKGSTKNKTIDIIIDSEDSSIINIRSSGENSELNISSESTVNVVADNVNIEAGEELNLSMKTYGVKSSISISEDEIKLEDNSGSKVSLKDGKVTFNDGENGEMINISDLTTKLNSLVTTVNTHIAKYNSHVHPVAALPNPTGATISSVVTTSLSTTASNFSENDFKDDNVIH